MFRLKELRLENGLRRSEFAKAIGMPVSTVANYENETRQASYEALIVFANYFGVSIDYLLGHTNEFRLKDDAGKSQGVLSSEERKLLNVYRQCSNLGKTRILEYAQLIEKNL